MNPYVSLRRYDPDQVMRVKGEHPTLSLFTGSPLFCQFEYRLRDASCQESDQVPHLQDSRSSSIKNLVPTPGVLLKQQSRVVIIDATTMRNQ